MAQGKFFLPFTTSDRHHYALLLNSIIFSVISLQSPYKLTRMKIHVILRFLFFNLFFNIGYTQQSGYLFKHLTTENGLVSNRVMTILHDQEGFVWIGTQVGLQRYDGKRFTTYVADVHNPDALQSDWILPIFEDSKKRLWIGTDQGGPYILNRSNGKFYNFNLHLNAGTNKINGVWQFLEDRQGHIWLSAFDGYYKLNDTTLQFQPVNALLHMENNILPSSISMDQAGNLWFATTGGIKELDIKSGIVYDQDNNPGHLAIFDIKGQVNTIIFDKLDHIWVSSGFGYYLYKYSTKANSIKSYSFDAIEKGQTNSPAPKAFIGRPFLCSNGQLILPVISEGLAMYDEISDSFSILKANNNTPYGFYLDKDAYGGFELTEDAEKNIWISSIAGIIIYNLDKPPFTTYTSFQINSSSRLPNEFVSDILQTQDGDIYISYDKENGGILRLDENLNFKYHYLCSKNGDTLRTSNQVWNLFEDNAGMIWAPNQSGDILKINPKDNSITLWKDSTLNGTIYQIQQDANGNIWVGHQRKGLLRIDALSKKITVYDQFKKPDPIPSHRVLCFLFDQDLIWVGTRLNGLQLFDTKSGLFTEAFVLNERDSQSISNNNVTAILPYNDDTLIVATQGGINIFDKRKKIFSVISSKDGLPNNLVNGLILDNDHNLWASFYGGLSKIDIQHHDIINYDIDDGIIDNKFNSRFIMLRDGRIMAGATNSLMVFNPAQVTAGKIPPDVTITGFKLMDKSLIIDSLINSSKPLVLSYQDNSFHVEFSSLQFNTATTTKYFYQLVGIDQHWMPADRDNSVNYHQLPPGNYIFNLKCANREGIFSKNITTLAINILPPFWKRWWFILLISSLVLYTLFSFVKWRENNIKALEYGKTRLQQMTAEQYKAQYESEQISHFFSSSLLYKHNVDDVLWDVAKNLISKLGFIDCRIYLWDDDKISLSQKAGYGPTGSMLGIDNDEAYFMPGEDLAGIVARSGEATILSEPMLSQLKSMDGTDKKSEICVPITFNEEILGVIDSQHAEKNFFTRQHLQALTTIATLMASKIKSIQAEQRLRHQQAELADINRQMSEAQLTALRSQMNPHFIFNALNSIKKFVIANEPVNAEKYLGKFSKLIRSILDNSQEGMVTIEKEVQLLTLYLDLEQLRFGDKLSYKLMVDDSLNISDTYIPSMIVQPFVENAMLHGILHKEDSGKVTIDFISHTDWLEIIIEDNGVGRTASAAYKSENTEPHHSIGIKVAAKRMHALKKYSVTPAGIDIIDLINDAGKGIGTKVILSIPLA